MQVRRAQPSDIRDLVRLNGTVQERHHEAEPHLYGPHENDRVEDFLLEWLRSEDKEI
jgi:hypothetical protein